MLLAYLKRCFLHKNDEMARKTPATTYSELFNAKKANFLSKIGFYLLIILNLLFIQVRIINHLCLWYRES